ncbi:MAG TPA: hypothetical protein DIT35_01515 [Rhodospirillaceae bacterium]|nr:hypothetical protein [Rhodospirillaceae bacterium]
MGIKTYTVHISGWSAARADDAILIREGFSAAAFLLGPFWALWHGMWRTAIALLLAVCMVSCSAAAAGLTEEAHITVFLGLQAAVGLWANDWRRYVLARSGVFERSTVAARRLRDAEWYHLSGSV